MDHNESKRQTAGSCAGERSGCAVKATGTEESLEVLLEQKALDDRMRLIRHKVMVLSGKGGVGKSTVAVNLAVSLSLAGKSVGLLDVDIHGPSIPKMLRLDDTKVQIEHGAILPIEKGGIKVMSIGFLLQNHDDAVIWRGPMKMGVIKQFLQDVEWGELDYLVIDSPPGTGDEPLSVCQLVKNADGAVIVTTPQDVATTDVRKSITFCRQLSLPVLGVVENMSGFVCPKCGTVTDIFKTGGGERMASEMKVPFLGRIPIDPAVGQACDDGKPFVYHYSRTETAKAFERIISPVLALSEPITVRSAVTTNNKEEGLVMKIAIPMADGKLCMHFGHCEQFALIDADEKTKKITGRQLLTPPAHEPGVLPKWLHEQGANVIIAGGMGQRAQNLFAENDIKVVVGAPGDEPDKLVISYLEGTLVSGTNVCDH
ncbi:MAG: P-loop NTPase [Verrucomicrobia bacterium]|nr:P-loop NTPase [Verrucomicrobiota bacterium]MBU1733937.1 P-loop NTPase [Verrucomicrobiota bacterium]MBU1857291.1 P-loop NTPase [Verrucomicrobiota bacterium]